MFFPPKKFCKEGKQQGSELLLRWQPGSKSWKSKHEGKLGAQNRKVLMPNPRESSLRLILLWWVTLLIGKGSMSSAGTRFRCFLLSKYIHILTHLSLMSTLSPKTPGVPACFLLSLQHSPSSTGTFHPVKTPQPFCIPPLTTWGIWQEESSGSSREFQTNKG